MGIFAALIPLACLVGIFYVMIRGAVPAREGRPDLRPAAVPITGAAAYFEGLLAAIALSQILVWFSPSGFGIGVDVVGAIFGMFVGLVVAFEALRQPAQWLFSVVGLVASVPAMGVLLFSDSPCFAVAAHTRQGLTLALVTIFLVVTMRSLLMRRTGKNAVKAAEELGAVGLGWFGLMELLLLVSTDLGLAGISAGGLFVAFGAVIAVGVLTPLFPRIVLPLMGAGMGILSILGGTIFGSQGAAAQQCMGTDANPITLGVFVVVSAIVWGLLSRFVRK